MVEKVYVLSHTDLDGYFSAGLVEHYYRLINPEAEFTHKSWTYGRDIPNINYIKNNFDKVFIVDLCPDFGFMYSIWEHFQNNFTWIDHHTKPDSEFLEKFSSLSSSKIYGLRETEEHKSSAALLVFNYYEHFRGNTAPSWLKYISDFDCWNRYDDDDWNNKIMPMFSYLKGLVTSPKTAYAYCEERFSASEFYDSPAGQERTNKEIEIGKIMYQCTKAMYNADAKHGFERVFDAVTSQGRRTFKAWVCNTQNRSSVIFEDMPNRDDYDVFIPYHFNGERYMYSMYTFKDDIACNDMTIVRDRNDGYVEYGLAFNGHKDAAGANSEKFEFAK